MYISKRSGMDHTVLPANTPCLIPDTLRSVATVERFWATSYSCSIPCLLQPDCLKNWQCQTFDAVFLFMPSPIINVISKVSI